MTITTYRVTVVLVNWERPGDTIECVRSVLEVNTSDVQVLVVDNGSRDDSVAQISQTFPQIKLLSLPHNLGFAGGYNEGIKQALQNKAPHIFLLNNDTTVDPDAINALLDAPWDVAIPKILFYEQPERIWAAGSYWRLFPPAVIMRGFQKNDGPAYDKPVPLEFATACAVLAKRKVFEKIGGFDPDFENYMEDYDFFYRVRAAGFTVGYVPSARILHKGAQTLGENSPQFWQYLGRNAVLFYRKNNRFAPWKLWSFLVWVTFRETIKGHAAFLRSYWRGVREGFDFLESME